MIQQIIFSRDAQEISAIGYDGNIIATWECRDDFVSGFNEEGEPRESLPNGIYTDLEADVYDPGEQDQAFGTFYITTGDPRGRDIHGGGSGLFDPYAPRQGWVPTWGCLRMQNEDGIELCEMINEAAEKGMSVRLVVED